MDQRAELLSYAGSRFSPRFSPRHTIHDPPDSRHFKPSYNHDHALEHRTLFHGASLLHLDILLRVCFPVFNDTLTRRLPSTYQKIKSTLG